jgi:thiosulfate reductase cytochrome b subunit
VAAGFLFMNKKYFTMKASAERKIIRWLHIITSIPLVGYVYGPLKNLPHAVFVLKWVLFPLVVISGLWMWKGHLLKKRLRKMSQIDPQ